MREFRIEVSLKWIMKWTCSDNSG